jgi:hypothetical protein
MVLGLLRQWHHSAISKQNIYRYSTFVVRTIDLTRWREPLIECHTPTIKKYSFVHHRSTPFLEVLGTKNRPLDLKMECPRSSSAKQLIDE